MRPGLCYKAQEYLCVSYQLYDGGPEVPHCRPAAESWNAGTCLAATETASHPAKVTGREMHNTIAVTQGFPHVQFPTYIHRCRDKWFHACPAHQIDGRLRLFQREALQCTCRFQRCLYMFVRACASPNHSRTRASKFRELLPFVTSCHIEGKQLRLPTHTYAAAPQQSTDMLNNCAWKH